jgi:hypothetical protein
LTDPDVLADYTCEFFGENGPYPVGEEPAGQVVGNPGITAEQQMQLHYNSSKLQQHRQDNLQADPRFARPQMPVPPQPQAPGKHW